MEAAERPSSKEILAQVPGSLRPIQAMQQLQCADIQSRTASSPEQLVAWLSADGVEAARIYRDPSDPHWWVEVIWVENNVIYRTGSHPQFFRGHEQEFRNMSNVSVENGAFPDIPSKDEAVEAVMEDTSGLVSPLMETDLPQAETELG